ncbi:MAG TPA: hypothetical protein VGO26_05500, partial [Amnibacterium sp.]|nr:hypothetical protein [Amnibacterium sp.]
MQRLGWRAVLAMSTALVLAGCAQTAAPPVRSSTPVATPTPAYRSNAEAKATLSRFYSEYVAVVDEVLGRGGQRPERLAKYLSSQLFQRELDTMSTLRSSGRHTVGRST